MRLYSYVVARDFGFAPNPFFGTCTLATCKPDIRRAAIVGDWIVGTGSKTRKRHGNLVYVMQVDEKMTFNQYWEDRRFQLKKPNLNGSIKQRFGDNIYQLDSDGQWLQSDSHHSLKDGSPNPKNIRRDTKADSVLVGSIFAYWGGSGPEIPSPFQSGYGAELCKSGPGHKCHFPESMVDAFVAWFMDRGERGFLGDPLDWERLT